MNQLTFHQAQTHLAGLISGNSATVTNLINLLGDVVGKVMELVSGENIFILQSGFLRNGEHASEASGKIINEVPGRHDVGSSHIGWFLGSEEFDTALRNAIAHEEFALASVLR